MIILQKITKHKPPWTKLCILYPKCPGNIPWKSETQQQKSLIPYYSPEEKKGLILIFIRTVIRVSAVRRAGLQMDATVRVHRQHGAEAAIYGHHAAIAVAVAVAVAVAAIVIIGDHHHLCRFSCCETQKGKKLHFANISRGTLKLFVKL